MLYEKLHQRYGNYIAKRVQEALTVTEFKMVSVSGLAAYLETRAVAAHKEYQAHTGNPYITRADSKHMDAFYARWQEAEDLAYLVAVTEDVSSKATFLMVKSR